MSPPKPQQVKYYRMERVNDIGWQAFEVEFPAGTVKEKRLEPSPNIGVIVEQHLMDAMRQNARKK